MEKGSYARTATIACVNFAPVWGDKTANFNKIKKFIDQAADQCNDLVIFPELSLTGYDCADEFAAGCSMHRQLAETVPGPTSEEIAQIAKKKNIYVIFSLPEKDAAGNLYISAPVIGPEGLLGVYRKVHLMISPATEDKCFKPGNSLPVFETRFGKIGVQICYDFWGFPECSRILALKGAEIIINPTASTSGAGKEEFMVHLTRSRGVENMCYAASANLTGKDRKNSFYGHSTVAGRGWKVTTIYAEGGPEEGIVSCALNMEMMRKARAARPLSPEVCQAQLLAKEWQEIAQKIKA